MRRLRCGSLGDSLWPHYKTCRVLTLDGWLTPCAFTVLTDMYLEMHAGLSWLIVAYHAPLTRVDVTLLVQMISDISRELEDVIKFCSGRFDICLSGL